MSIVLGVPRAMGARTVLLLALLASAVTALALAAPAAAAPPDADPYIVVLNDDVVHPANVAHRHEENRGAKLGHIYGTAIKGYSAELTPGELRAIKQDPNVDYVDYDMPVRAMSQAMPTGVKRIYGLTNPTLDIDEKDDVQVNVDVAVLDGGVQANHPDLRVVASTNCLVTGTHCVDGPTSVTAHATHVAGIIGALDNSFGVVGVAPGARIWNVKTIAAGASGPSADGQMSDVVAAVNWVTERADQIEVVNMSLGCDPDPSFDEPDLEEKACVQAETSMNQAISKSIDEGVVYVVSAGNRGIDVQGLDLQGTVHDELKHIPAAFSDPIVVTNLSDYDGQAGGLAPLPASYGGCEPVRVGLVDADDTLANSSNWGTTVDIAAPGTCILSTWTGSGYGTMTGTSQATPHVAGAAAILAARENPNNRLNVFEIRKKLLENGNYNWTDDGAYDSENKVIAGPDGEKEPLLDISNANVFKVPHPGNVTGTGATSHTAGAMQLYARTETGGIAAKDYNPYANPFGWQPWGEGVGLPINSISGKPMPMVGSPAVISRSASTRDIFIRGEDNNLFFRHFDSATGGWGAWNWIQGPNNQPITSSPAAVKNPGIAGALSLAVRGSDGNYYFKNYDPATNQWSGWIGIGVPPGGATTSAPTIAIYLWNQLHIMVRGADGALWDRFWSPETGWGAWYSLGGVLTSSPNATATNSQKDLYVFGKGTDGALWFRRFSADLGYTWTPWNTLGGNWISVPSSTTRDNFGVDVFMVGTDGKVQNRRFTSGTWTNWMRIDDDCPPNTC